MLQKLILGTAGLGGLPYGRERRRVGEADAIRLIQHAYASGVHVFDTAPAYGEAERWLGKALATRPSGIWTKTTGDADQAITSIETLGGFVSIPGRVSFLWHNWEGQDLPPWVGGVSVYAADILAPPVDVAVQQDWNLLQQNIPNKPRTFIARSVFLQGRLTEEGFGSDENVSAPIERARRMAAVYGVDLTYLALRAALQCPQIDHVVIGPTTMDELERCLDIAQAKPLGLQPAHLRLLACDDDAVTDPRTWGKAAVRP